MTDAEKKMKKYTNSVERRLNLPKDVKARVMSDFFSSIAARREAGQTDEEIYAELGEPRKAAAELNEQMKEFAYRKSPWRFLFVALAVYGAVELLGSLAAWITLLALTDSYLFRSDAASIGIIGGADGPTSIFLATSVPGGTQWIVPILLLIVGIWGSLRLRKCKQK